MDESSVYRHRLQAITEKRKVLEQIERNRRELEDKKLKLQQLKRKSLRDRWLMEGLSPPSDESNPSSPLWQTQCQIQQLEDTLASLESQVNDLETQRSHLSSLEAVALQADAATEDSGTDSLPGTEREHLPKITEKRDLQDNGELQLAGPCVLDTADDSMTCPLISTQENTQQMVTPESPTVVKETRNCAISLDPVSILSPAEQYLSLGEPALTKSSETLQLALQEVFGQDEIKHHHLLPPSHHNTQVLSSTLAATLSQGIGLDGVIRAERVLVTEDSDDVQVESSDTHGAGTPVTTMSAAVNGDPSTKTSSLKDTHPTAQASLNHLVLPEATRQKEGVLSIPQSQVTGAHKEKPLPSGHIGTLQWQLTEQPEKVFTIHEQNIYIHEHMATDQGQKTPPLQEIPTNQEQILTHLNQLPSLAENTVSTEHEQVLPTQQEIPTHHEQILTYLNQFPSLSNDTVTTHHEQIPPAHQEIPTCHEQIPSGKQETPTHQEQILTHLNKLPSLAEETMSTQHEQTPPAQQVISTNHEQISTHLNQLPSLTKDTVSTHHEQIPPAQQEIPPHHKQILTHLNQLSSLAEDTVPTDHEQIPPSQQEILTDQEQISTHLNQLPSLPVPTHHKQRPQAQQEISTNQEQILTHLNQFLLLPEDTMSTHHEQIPPTKQEVPTHHEQISTHLNQLPLLPKDTVPTHHEQISTHLNQLLLLPKDTVPTHHEQISPAQQEIPTHHKQEIPTDQEQILALQLPERTLVTKSKDDLEPSGVLDPEQQPLLQEATAPASQAFLDKRTTEQLPNTVPLKQPSARSGGTELHSPTSTNTGQTGQERSAVRGAEGTGPKQKTCHCCSVM